MEEGVSLPVLAVSDTLLNGKRGKTPKEVFLGRFVAFAGLGKGVGRLLSKV